MVLGEGILRMLDVLGGGSRVLLILEDLQWADPESLTCSGLPRRSRRRRVGGLCGYRSAGTFARADAGAGLPRQTDRVRAGGTTVDPRRRRPRWPWSASGRPCSRTASITSWQRADGLPFLVEELLSAAVDVNALVRGPTGWILRPDAATVVPQSLADTVTQRIDALDPADRNVPYAAAVLGRRFDPELICSMTGLPTSGVRAALDRCISSQLVTIDPEGYQFRHALTRDAVLAGMAAAARGATGPQCACRSGRSSSGPARSMVQPRRRAQRTGRRPGGRRRPVARGWSTCRHRWRAFHRGRRPRPGSPIGRRQFPAGHRDRR